MHAPFVMVGLVTLGAVGLAARESAAQPTRPAATQPAQRPPTLREAVQRLQSSNPDEVSDAIDALTRIGTPEVVPPLVALIHQGLPDDLLETVVTKLGIIGRPEAIDELSALLHHRRPAVRQKAVTALSRIRDPRVRALIESALRDSDGAVRGEAATALGRINARASVELLQRAFERNVPEAAESIGALGDVAAADRLLEAVGRARLSVLLPGFRRFLDRRDLSDDTKVRIIEQLVTRAPTAEVKAFLREWVATVLPTDRTRTRARARAERAIRQINDAPAGSPAPAAAPTPAGGAR